MRKPHEQGRYAVLRRAVVGLRTVELCILLTGLLLAWCPRAMALDPSLDLSQYAHTAWKVRDGFAKGVISAIAQTPDGYLWLGTEFGLLRFDGVRVVSWQPPFAQHLPSDYIMRLLVARDGTLWIGTLKGLASWRDNKLTQYPELDGQYIFALLEDREGALWASGYASPRGRLCAIRKSDIQCYGDDGALGPGAFNLHEDSKGNLWAGVKDGLWRWRPGSPKFYRLPGEPNGIQALSEDSDGTLLVGWKGGIYRFTDGKTEAYPTSGIRQQFRANGILRGHGGDLWIATDRQGLVHLRQGRTDVFRGSDNLSGDTVSSFFEDREGNVWVTTMDGLDRFRDFAVATFTAKQGLVDQNVGSVLAARDGSVWLTTSGGLNRWTNGQIASFGQLNGKLNGHVPISFLQDSRGRIWVSTTEGGGYLESDRVSPINGVPGGPVHGIAEDTAGNLWIANQEQGLLRLVGDRLAEKISWAQLGHNATASALIADPVQGGLWLGFIYGGLAYFKDGRIRATYERSDGLGDGRVNTLRLDADGALWAATDGGLSRLKNGHIATLTSKNGLPCDAVHWSMEDDAGSVWLSMPCGLVRLARSDLIEWAAAAVKDTSGEAKRILATVFDGSDGVRAPGAGYGYGALVAKASDGKLWFVAPDGVSVVDPVHLPFNKLPPPVHIEQITADRKTYDASFDVSGDANGHMRLPPLIRDLEIDYTALSFVAPEKNRFRYKLEGWDRDWQDIGNRRQAFYNNLAPGNYRFRVTASNNSGVWNEAGTFLDFSIAPAYYQTNWFRATCVSAIMLMLWGLYRLRLRQLAREFNTGLEARVSERTRIARELHDTLLQSFNGLLLRFQTISNTLPPGDTKQKLDSAIDRTALAITEGRDAVQGLRKFTMTTDLPQAVNALGQELADSGGGKTRAAFHVEVEGKPRAKHAVTRDEVYRITGEAIRNAFKHARARKVEVQIWYGTARFRVRVRDDGRGIDRSLLSDQGRPGHFGLHGMRERAEAIGGRLEIWSEVDCGTEVEFSIPAQKAYVDGGTRRFALLEKLREKFNRKETTRKL